MVADTDTKWRMLKQRLSSLTGEPLSIEDVLLKIGLQEAGLPPKLLQPHETAELTELGTCAVLVAARYYELFWVDDTGRPHYRQLQRVPAMNDADREAFLKPYILLYAEKNRWI
jgi:hypothetical protein